MKSNLNSDLDMNRGDASGCDEDEAVIRLRHQILRLRCVGLTFQADELQKTLKERLIKSEEPLPQRILDIG
jgi:hypothetical protein